MWLFHKEQLYKRVGGLSQGQRFVDQEQYLKDRQNLDIYLDIMDKKYK